MGQRCSSNFSRFFARKRLKLLLQRRMFGRADVINGYNSAHAPISLHYRLFLRDDYTGRRIRRLAPVANAFLKHQSVWATIIGLILVYLAVGYSIGGGWGGPSPYLRTMYAIISLGGVSPRAVPLL